MPVGSSYINQSSFEHDKGLKHIEQKGKITRGWLRFQFGSFICMHISIISIVVVAEFKVEIDRVVRVLVLA